MDRSRSGKIGGLILLMEGGFFIVADHPASPISRYSGEVVLSEVVPEEWWGSWIGQIATESLL